MDIKTFIKCVEMLPPNKSVMIMGGHGIGKSQLVRLVARSIAKSKGWDDYKVVDRRLSQMSEGDMIGLPFKIGEGDKVRTKFAAMDWFMECCDEPRLLFLDEGNRASGEVIQAAFQIGLDHELNGNILHPETRVFMAVNDDSSKYQVTDFDPAFLSRWWVCKLTPTWDEWYEWASATSTPYPDSGHIHPDILNFLNLHRTMLDPAASAENMEKDADRRSWDHFSKSYVENKLGENDMKNETARNTIQQFASGFVGMTTSIAFSTYLATSERYVTVEEVLFEYDKNEKRIAAITVSEIGSLNTKMVEWMRTNTLADGSSLQNFARYFKTIPAEIAVALWQDIAKYPTETTTNIKLMHSHIVDVIMSACSKQTKL